MQVTGFLRQGERVTGADGYRALWNQRRALAVTAAIHPSRVEHLLNRYGSCVHELLAPDDDTAEAARLGAPDIAARREAPPVAEEGARSKKPSHD